MRIHFHDYGASGAEGILDGAILMHLEMRERLLARGEVIFHDITRGSSSLEGVRDEDVVYAGIGPYAYLYHLWRERTGAKFRIIREVHTTFWSGYWGQEEACANFIRPGDRVLFPTEYARQLYIQLHGSVTPENSGVVYPLLDRLPRVVPPRSLSRHKGLRLGYLGALSYAKNFDQVLNIFLACYRRTGGRASLSIAGKPNDARWEQAQVRAMLESQGVAPSHIHTRGVIGQQELGAFFEDMDVLLFPSTASRESLGRVVLEALAHGVPVIAADKGPAVELLPPSNLIPTRLFDGPIFRMDKVVALGQVNEAVAVDMLLEGTFEPAKILEAAPYDSLRFNESLEAEPRSWPEIPGWDTTIGECLQVSRQEQQVGLGTLAEAEALFLEYFQGDVQALRRRILHQPGLEEQVCAQLLSLVERPTRKLADYRGYPRLVDALLLEPRTFTLRQPAAQAHMRGAV
jgi:glycosyltransferase involved in cell wall biosynthesis